MTADEKKVFSLRISQGSKTEIVVISYEIILNYIESANECFRSGDMDEMVKNLKAAKAFIDDLASSLDLKYGISYDLLNLYRYSNKIILSCIIKKSVEGLATVENIIRNLMESFSKVAKQDTRGSAIEGSSRVFAGLTYGNNSKLNEVCYSFDKKDFLG